MAEPPKLTDEQRQAALEKAAEARRVRADVKERLKTGSLTLSGLFELAGRDEMVGKLKVLALLESLPGVGKVKARRTMEEIGIAESRRVQGLGAQQRGRLLELFGSAGIVASAEARRDKGETGHEDGKADGPVFRGGGCGWPRRRMGIPGRGLSDL